MSCRYELVQQGYTQCLATCSRGRKGGSQMSRKAQTDSGETKRGLVVSATEEFAEYGYEGASLRQICSKAGVTTGALYFFFDSKEDLFKSVISPLMSEFPTILATWIERDLSVICDGKGEPTNVEQLPDGLAQLLEQYPLVPKIVMSNRDNPVVKGYLDAKVDEIAVSIASRASLRVFLLLCVRMHSSRFSQTMMT